VLPQAVTTVWRTELGTTLLNGFDSTTDTSAYFHYLAHLSLPRPPYEAEFLSRMASRHAGASLLTDRTGLPTWRPSFRTGILHANSTT